ncbi:hypothetical protein [Novosphingobium rosa]|uniref:hypothetical protein n=1 Tax=Novosphingobium rosa TaxID=76978 RepID=UPI000AB0C3A5|nr:hypothetical protein [Novosphingobium rosa]
MENDAFPHRSGSFLKWVTHKPYDRRQLATAITKNVSLADLFERLGDPPMNLRPTADGDDLAKHRYKTAEMFYPVRDFWPRDRISHLYYSAGMTAQFALSAHILKAGVPDSWCAARIGYLVAHSLAYANATGLNHHCRRMARLAAVLTPYWRWNAHSKFQYGHPDDPGFEPDEICSLLRGLLAKVRMTTGFALIDNDLA